LVTQPVPWRRPGTSSSPGFVVQELTGPLGISAGWSSTLAMVVFGPSCLLPLASCPPGSGLLLALPFFLPLPSSLWQLRQPPRPSMRNPSRHPASQTHDLGLAKLQGGMISCLATGRPRVFHSVAVEVIRLPHLPLSILGGSRSTRSTILCTRNTRWGMAGRAGRSGVLARVRRLQDVCAAREDARTQVRASLFFAFASLPVSGHALLPLSSQTPGKKQI
jgi:hypothetical protein